MYRVFKVFLIALLWTGFRCAAQCPANIGFETGDFSNWSCYTGNIDMNGNITVMPSGPVYNRHTMIDSSDRSTDKYGGFPIACPNGSRYSIRLGNDDTHAEAERVTYEFVVPDGSQYTLLFNYAVVLQNPNHEPYQQPKFTAQIFDESDNKYIDCPSFDFVASTDLPGFKLSNIEGANTAIYYKEWSTASINLTGYSGKTMRLEFTTNDCTAGGHFGYAYIDVAEPCGSPITGNNDCIGQDNITKLYAPAGFQTYQWYTGDLKTKLDTGRTLTMKPSPANGTQIGLVLQPYDGLGCVDTIYTTINKVNAPFVFKVIDTLNGCINYGADLASPAVMAGSSTDMTYSYYTDPVNLTYVYNPRHITTSGTYYIRGVNSVGCQDILPIYVNITTPQIAVSDPRTVTYPQTIDLSGTFMHLPGYSYSYWADSTSRNLISNTVTKSGTYYVKGINEYGCPIVGTVHVIVNPPPPYLINVPSAFTPNGDGINDNFSVSIVGYVSLNMMRIFNRNGQLLFTGKSLPEYWDGNYNGKPVPAGTYYWLFNGTDDFYHVPVTRSGSIVLIR